VATLGAIVLVATWAGPDAIALEQRWRRGAGFDPRAAYPLREANATAQRLEEVVSKLDRVVRWLPPLLVRLGVAQYVDSMEHAIGRLERLDMRAHDPERFRAEEGQRIPRWNVLGRELLPNFFETYVRAAGHDLDVELTLQLLAARERLAAHGRDGLADLPARRPSAVRGFTWVYELGAAALTIRADHPRPLARPEALPLVVRVPLEAE
jgi:hypothetical protein